MEKGQVEGSFLTYQGKPFVRQDNAYVWGDMRDKAVVVLFVLTNKTVNGTEVPDDILVQVVSTDDKHEVLKSGQKKGLYEKKDRQVLFLLLKILYLMDFSKYVLRTCY